MFNIGPMDSFDFDQAVVRMADLVGLPVARVRLATPPTVATLASTRAMSVLGFEPRHTMLDMIEEAAAAWKARRSK